MDIVEEVNNFLNESNPQEVSQNIMHGMKAGVVFEDIPGMRTKANMMLSRGNKPTNRDPKETLRRFLSGGL